MPLGVQARALLPAWRRAGPADCAYQALQAAHPTHLISAWTVLVRAHVTVQGDLIPNGTTPRAFLLRLWLILWPPGIRPRWSRTVTHQAFIALATSHRCSCRELGLAGSRHSSLAKASGATSPLHVHVPELASRGFTMYPRQVAARPPPYLLSSPSRRQPEAPAPSRSWRNGRDSTDEQGSHRVKT